MGAVSMTRLIMIATTAISVSSRFTSCKGNDLATCINNRDSHYEFLETHTDKRCSEISKATALTGACKDTPWSQVTCTVACPLLQSLAAMRPLRTILFLTYRIIPPSAAVKLLLAKLRQIHRKFPRATGTLMSHI